MSKSKKSKKKPSLGQKNFKESKSNISGSGKYCIIMSKVGKIILILLSIWGGWVTLVPRVFVDSLVNLDPNNPANIPFVVQNNGYLSIHDVKFTCSMKSLTFPGGIRAIAQVPYDNCFSGPKQVSHMIAPGERSTEFLPFLYMEHNKIEESDIAIVLTFKPIKWLPWRCKTMHRFISYQENGQWHWSPQPIDK